MSPAPLIGLNQAGGEDCFDLQPGDRLCSFTPDVSDEESALIATMLVPPAPADRKAPPADGPGAAPVTLDAPALQALDALLKTR